MARPHPALLALLRGGPLPPFGDGQAVLRSAVEHRVGGLLWSRILAGDAVTSGPWLAELARQDLWARRHHDSLWSALAEVTGRLGEEGIVVAAMKGVTTEHRWYQRTGERPSGDLDLLLVDPSRVRDAVRVLAPQHPWLATISELSTRGHAMAVELEVGGQIVDLHTDLLKLQLPMRSPQAVTAGLETMSGPGGDLVTVLDDEWQLLGSLLHLNKDRFRDLLGYIDVVRAVDAGADLRRVLDLARHEGLEVPAAASLSAVLQAAGRAPVPVPRGWRRQLWRRLWPPATRLQGSAAYVRYRYRQDVLGLLVEGRLAETLRVRGVGRLFPPAVVMDHFYGPQRGPYLWRLAAGRVRALRERTRSRTG